MAFTAEDLDEFMRLLRKDPDLRDRVRRLVLPDELLTLPELVRQNGEDIRALQQLVAQNSADIRALQAVVAQNSQDIRALQAVVAQNSEDIRALAAEVRELADIVRKHDSRLARIDGRPGSPEGDLARLRWEANFAGRFGRLVQRARVISAADLELFEQAYEDETISEEDSLDVRRLDLIISGKRGRGAEREDVVLAVEVSIRVEPSDIDRAARRASTLRSVGYNAVPVVAGALIDPVLKSDAEGRGVAVVVRPEDLVVVPDDSV